jgi:predicted ATP-grasp superfamily ATP-dependent carboligase
VAGQPLSAILERGSFDMLLPVGAESVKTAARACPDRCLLPPQESLTACFDKWKTLQLAADIGVPAPRSYLVTCQKDLSSVDLEFPCVVKASREDSANKSVAYPASRSELLQVAGDLLRDSSGEPILVQEFVRGCGCGLFALYDHGRPVRVFMHRRLREFPPSGGVSTAARAVFSEQLKEYGLGLLSALRWNGVAMVEFRTDELMNRFSLMEINAKFWGSTELALHCGVNFGADAIRVFRGEGLGYSEVYDRERRFYWPLDGDLLTLWRTGRLSLAREYWEPSAATNLSQSLRADLWKTARLVKKVVFG